MSSSVGQEVLECASRAARDSDLPLLLAVSGGLDSMVLLDAFAAAAAGQVAAVATFDHGTGAHAMRAARLVAREARKRGLAVVTGRLSDQPPAEVRNGLEAMWREARHRFLADAASERGARVVTAHTRDDQIETVLMRELRGSGARGLPGKPRRAPSCARSSSCGGARSKSTRGREGCRGRKIRAMPVGRSCAIACGTTSCRRCDGPMHRSTTPSGRSVKAPRSGGPRWRRWWMLSYRSANPIAQQSSSRRRNSRDMARVRCRCCGPHWRGVSDSRSTDAELTGVQPLQ